MWRLLQQARPCQCPERELLLAQQPPCDHLRLDLGRTLEDVEDARVAQHAADLVLGGVAVAAVDLERVVGAGPGDGSTQQLGEAGLEVAAAVGVLLARGDRA